MSGEPGLNRVSPMLGLSPPSTGTFSSVGDAESNHFKNQIQNQIMQVQRWLKELQNNQALEKTNTVSFAQTKAMEKTLANLQKIVAAQADTNKKLQEEATDKNATTQTLFEAMGVDLAAVKTTAENLMRQVEEHERSEGGGGASANISLPDNMNETFEALKRQLGTYVVKLEEMDLRFQPDEPGSSRVSSMPGPSPPSLGTFSSVGVAELEHFKNQMQSQIMQVQRWLKELQNNQALEKAKTVSFAQTLNLSKNQAKAMETRLANLQARLKL
uniref:uncharacterized protein LOC120335039 n=1 Tax=Styela clava TaxID=7725 RepID=UPI00193A4B7E|nr:uncharacterized protein LOC120335039 [Styela clava]